MKKIEEKANENFPFVLKYFFFLLPSINITQSYTLQKLFLKPFAK